MGMHAMLAQFFRSNIISSFAPSIAKRSCGANVEARLKTLLTEKAQTLHITVHTMEVMPDHVHLFVESDPGMAPAKIAAQLKGYTSRVLRQEFRHLRSQLPVVVESQLLHWQRGACLGSHGPALYREPEGTVVDAQDDEIPPLSDHGTQRTGT